MTAPVIEAGFEAAITRRLAAARLDLCARLAGAVPGDVAVTETAGGVALTGRALARRSLDDARLRDFAGLLR